MKKLVLGMALFAGSFALANEPVKENDSKIQTSDVACSCELDGTGTCYITVYYPGGGSQTYVYYNVTQAWCDWKALGFSIGA